MSHFEKAVEIVRESLQQIDSQGGKLRVSRSSLKKLASARPAVAADSDSVLVARKSQSPVVAPVTPKLATALQPAPAKPSATTGDKAARFAALRERALVCTKCPHLAASRTQVVFGVGNIDAELMFVGEAPGADEDEQGEPFVGRAGQMLTKMIVAMGLTRDDVYIANILKCRPDMPPGEPGNRKPRPEEMAACLPYLLEQIEIIQPRALVALGASAIQGLLGNTTSMGQLRGNWLDFHGIPLMPTFHPAYLLYNSSHTEKRKVWEDLMQVLERLGHPLSEKQRGFFLQKT